jgi:hypothetical protein
MGDALKGLFVIVILVLMVAARWRYTMRFFRIVLGQERPSDIRSLDLLQAFVLLILMVGIGGWMVTRGDTGLLTWLFFLGIVLYYFLLSGEKPR